MSFSRKLEFFIGSTKGDLAGVRNKLINTILEAKHIPSGMELWAAGTEPLLNDISSRLETCDVHIIVLGARYGQYLDFNGQKISFTEWEYKQSNTKRHILVFVLNDNDFEKERKKQIKEDPSEQNKTDDLKRFRAELMENRFCKPFKMGNKSELGRLCVNAINELINSEKISEDVGWIRANSKEASTLKKIRENIFLQRELDRLSEFSILGERINFDKISKQKMAYTFWNVMTGKIRRHNYNNLFFESGSTLVYVSDEFKNSILKNDFDSWHIKTNNVITLIDLLLYTDVDISRFPDSAPDSKDKYGAILPREWNKLHETAPQEPRSLHECENKAIKKMTKDLCNLGKNMLFLTTISGWDLNNSFESFRGPHVGSHPNMLFKQAIFTSGKPVVIFLDAEKLGDPKTGNCYPIFDLDKQLNKTLSKYPISLCVGFNKNIEKTRKKITENIRLIRNSPEFIKKELNNLGFSTIYANTPVTDTDSGAIIAGNKKFSKLLPND